MLVSLKGSHLMLMLLCKKLGMKQNCGVSVVWHLGCWSKLLVSQLDTYVKACSTELV